MKLPFRAKKLPLSLRARFLLATAGVVFALTLSYGLVAVIGYSVSFDKTIYRLLRGESNIYFSLAQWNDNQLTINGPANLDLNFPTLVFIYDNRGKLLWRERSVPELEASIVHDWLGKPGYYEMDTNIRISNALLENNPKAQDQLQQLHSGNADVMTHSIAINSYEGTDRLPPLTIVVVDTVPQELQRTELVWSWFSYVLIANLLLVLPLLWLAAHWSLRPIARLSGQVRELEDGKRDQLEENTPSELRSLVSNLNILLSNERQRYTKYRTTLSDLTHSLKTPLAVLQSTLRSLRMGKQTTIEEAEPIMLEQISRISQQVGYYLQRASARSEQNMLVREVHSVSAMLDSLCFALNKVYQQKGVTIALDISPELTFVGEKNDFVEVMGNLLDNACKYCLEFVEVSAHHDTEQLRIIIDDDGPGISPDNRELIFQRGQRADTLRPGQGIGLAVANEIVHQYQGAITVANSELGGARMEVMFSRQRISYSDK